MAGRGSYREYLEALERLIKAYDASTRAHNDLADKLAEARDRIDVMVKVPAEADE